MSVLDEADEERTRQKEEGCRICGGDHRDPKDHRIAELEAKIAEAQGELDQAVLDLGGVQAEIERLKGLFISTCESRDAWIKQCDQAEAVSAGRLKALEEKAAEAKSEWLRAEQAEAEIERLKIVLRIPADHAHPPGTCFLAFEEQQTRMKQAESKLAQVVEAITAHLGALGYEPGEPCDMDVGCTLCGLSAALAAAKEKP